MNGAQSIQETRKESNLLRNALRGNAIFSSLSGLVSLFAAETLAELTGIQEPLVFTILGIVLLLFAVDIVWIASRKKIDRRFAWAVIILDVAWVVGSVIILLTDLVPLTVTGRWAVALIAEAVAVFAILQYVGLRRAQTGK